MQTKRCCLCKQDKPIEEFWKIKCSKDGLFSSCKKCNSKLKKRYYRKRKRYFKDYQKSYYNNVIVKNNIYYMCYRTLYSHKRKGYIIDITLPELITMAKEVDFCPICNIKLDKELGHKKTCQRNSLSFDCINNEKEFTRGNIQVICCHCNALKRKTGKGGEKVHTSKLLTKIQEMSKKLLIRKNKLSKDQIEMLEKCLNISSL